MCDAVLPGTLCIGQTQRKTYKTLVEWSSNTHAESKSLRYDELTDPYWCSNKRHTDIELELSWPSQGAYELGTHKW